MITIKGLDFYYPGSKEAALDGINLSIPEGALFGLLGPNGAGKTTLISLLTGLLVSKTGDIEINGHSLAREAKAIKKLTGYVPQDYAFYPSLTARENLIFFAGIQGIPKQKRAQRIEASLEFCQLTPVANKFAATFSGGLKRRLNIAIGLLTDPEIIYFDEPTTGIDPQSRAFILDQIQDLNKQGKTIIYTSHYMEEVEKLCDCLAIIDYGKVLVEGSLTELLQNMRNDFFIGCVDSLAQSDVENILRKHSARIEGNKIHFEETGSIKDFAELLIALGSLNIKVNHISYKNYDLETLFLKLTNRALRD